MTNRRLARALFLIITTALVAAVLGAVLRHSTAAAWTSVTAEGPARFDDAVSAVAGPAAFAILVWLVLGVLVSLVGELMTRTAQQRAVAALAETITPRLVRHAVAGLLGVAVVTGGASSAAAEPLTGPRAVGLSIPAIAAGAPQGTGCSQLPALDPGWVSSGSLTPGWRPARPAPAIACPVRAQPEAAIVTQPRRRASTSIDDEVVVRREDSLWSVTERHLGPQATAGEIALEWPRWFIANRGVIGSDPDHLRPGQRLRPPPTAIVSSHRHAMPTTDLAASTSNAVTGGPR